MTNPSVARKPPAGTRFESGRRPDEKASIYKAAFRVYSVCILCVFCVSKKWCPVIGQNKGTPE